jgi:hypothetical protein
MLTFSLNKVANASSFQFRLKNILVFDVVLKELAYVDDQPLKREYF